jgi:hypothetical protein
MLSVLREAWLTAVAAVAEADIDADHASDADYAYGASKRVTRADVAAAATMTTTMTTVAAVLYDAQRRVALLGGREGCARSLSSVYAGCVTRFLPAGFRGRARRSVYMDRTKTLVCPHGGRCDFSVCFGVAFTTDGSKVLTTMGRRSVAPCCIIYIWDAHTCDLVGFVHNCGDVPQYPQHRILSPRGLCVAPDNGFVFVVDATRGEVVVLTPAYAVHGAIGADVLHLPYSVAATTDLVAVTEMKDPSVCVFQRASGALLHRIGSPGAGDGQLRMPNSLCFAHEDEHIAVVDTCNFRVSVFNVRDGHFICHLQPHIRQSCRAVALDRDRLRQADLLAFVATCITCLRGGELVVAFDDVTVFSAEYAFVKILHTHDVTAVTAHGSRAAAAVSCAHAYGAILTLLE